MPQDPTKRFSCRVSDYAKYRPAYPAAILELLTTACDFSSRTVVADIASGTGLLTRLFLDHGCRVFGIEPNLEMRLEGERQLAGCPRFSSTDGAAEATTLPSGSVDIITVAQAFHWFDRAASAAEFRRILRPDGWVALIWNERRKQSSAFLRAYEDLLLRFGTDYRDVDHSRIDLEAIRKFFQSPTVGARTFENRQVLNYAGLEGRLLSSSYTPGVHHPQRSPMLAALKTIFDRHNDAGSVTIEYDTIVYIGAFT